MSDDRVIRDDLTPHNDEYDSTINQFQRVMIIITVMLVAVIEVLDMTIVNVALSPMMGSLSANQDQITWVLTSYIVASAIFMVLTGFLDKYFGRRRLLLINIFGFMLTSMLCGLAANLTQIVIFRILQGIFGACLVPLSQTIIRSVFPREQHGKAMAIWSMGIMVAPVLGPTLGGIITDQLTWRWVFYINVPFCLLALLLAFQFLKETAAKREPVDVLGMILMAVGIGSLQLFLDRGNSSDWFQSNFILTTLITSVVALFLFIRRSLNVANPVINVRLYLDKNFCLCSVLILFFVIGVLGIVSIEPLLLERFLGFPTRLAGIVMAPLGIASATAMLIVARIIQKVDPRKIMSAGLCFAAGGVFILSHYNLNTSAWYWMLGGAVQGFGMGMYFVPIATLSFITLRTDQIAEASGLFSFARNIGVSIGVSLMATVITRETQINWQQLGAHISVLNPNLQLWLNHQGWKSDDGIALSHLAQQLSLHAGMIAFLDVFFVVAIGLLMLIPFGFLLTWNKPSQSKSEQTSVDFHH